MTESETILLLADECDETRLLLRLLRQLGYRVRETRTRDSALRSIETIRPDLILMSAQLPSEPERYASCRALKARDGSRSIPVVIFGAPRDADDKQERFRAGCADYLSPPYQAEEVQARIGAQIQLRRLRGQFEATLAARTEALDARAARYRTLFAHCPGAILVHDCDTLQILTVNHSFTRLLGYRGDEVLGRDYDFARSDPPCAALTLAGRQEPPRLWRHSGGALLDLDTTQQEVDYGEQRARILLLRDMPAGSALRAEAEGFDLLTGLPNRRHFAGRLQEAIAAARAEGHWLAVCSIAVDDLKPILDSGNKALSQRLLAAVVERLRSQLRAGDLLARVGQSEFLLLMTTLCGETDLLARQRNLGELMAQPFRDDQLSLLLPASVGVTIYPDDDVGPGTLLRHADQAMDMARLACHGQGRYARFDAAGARRLRQRQQKIGDLRAALARREFVLHYQPKVCLLRDAVVGVEALLRWRRPGQGVLAAGKFLPDIEGDPFMVELGDWVIGEALAQAARWRQAGLALPVSVNVTPQQLTQSDFLDRLREQIATHADGGQLMLELEVLETSSLDDVDLVEHAITACQRMGVAVSLDDFGTGHSTLTYLRRLSASILKIDQSFVRNMLSNACDHAIVSGIITLAGALQRHVVAEGVETVAHGRRLLALGCSTMQGDGIARPMAGEDIADWIADWPSPAWRKVDQDAGFRRRQVQW